MHRLSEFCIIFVIFYYFVSNAQVHSRHSQRNRLTQNAETTPRNNQINNRGNTSSRQSLPNNEHDPGETSYDGPIIYPDAINNNCVHSLCYDVKDYPRDSVLQAIDRSEIARKYLDRIDINNRIGEDVIVTDTLCETKRQIIFPQTGKNLDNAMRTIVNIPDKQQGILSEICIEEGGPCKYSKNFPLGYSTSCKQKYSVVKLMIMTDNKTIDFDNFKIPQCCECTISKTM